MEVNGGHVFYFEYNPDFTFNKDAFKEYIRKVDASLVYICNPNNPTGYLHSTEFIKELVEEFPETMFLVDEAYYEFTNPRTTCCELVLNHDNLVVSRTMSKAFGIANFRFGYLIANEKNINYISTIRNPKNITTFAQEAACAVLEDVPYMDNFVKESNEAKAMFLEEIAKFQAIKAYKSNANFVVLRFESYEEKMKVFDYLVNNNIFVRTIDQSPIVHDCLRISIGTKEQMKRVLAVLKEYYAGK